MRLALTLSLLALAVPPAAQAATITVDRTTDAAPIAGECSDPAGADCSLRQAIDKAAAGDTVAIPANSAHYAVSSGELAVNKPITLAGDGARTTVIDAGGGSRRVLHLTGSGTVTVRGVTITGGNVPSGGGGGVLIDAGPTLSLEDSAVAANTAVDNGGGIFANGGGLQISNSAVVRNHGVTSSNGGGLAIVGGPGASLTNTTLAGNTVQNVGGGLEAQNVTVTVVNATITGNSQNSGGAIYPSTGATITLRNSIVAANTSASIPSQSNCVGAAFANPTSAGHNIEDQDNCGFAQPGDRANTAPQITPVQDNGGQTDTQAPLNGSPAIDAGDDSGCPATDQRGALRPAGAACDIGAYEVAVPAATTGAASGVTATGANLAGTVFNPDIAAGAAVFDYGTTTAYGQSTPALPVPAATREAPVSATLTNLTPSTLYHYRLRASNAPGFAVGADATFVTPPVISVLAGLRVTPSAFRAKRRRGAKVSYRASQPATVTFTVQRPRAGRRQDGRCRKVTRRNRSSRRRCTRWVKVRSSFRRPAVIGPNSFRFSVRKLKPGRYRLKAVARNSAGTGPAVTKRFRIKRR